MRQKSHNYISNLARKKFQLASGATALATVVALSGNAFAQEAAANANDGGATQLAPIVVSGQSGDASDNTTVAAKKSRGATKINTPLVETPRSVSVITKKEMEERGAQDIVEAVRYSAGVQTGSYGFDPRFDQIYVRGNDITTDGDYRDGLRQPYMNYAMFRTDPYALDRVEIIKGPVSVLYGAGSPGGIVNKISKLPTDETIREVGVLYGTSDRAQTMFDFGGRVNQDDDSMLYRIVGLARKGDTNFDIADDRYLIQPSFTWKPDDATKITIYGSAQSTETDANPGAMIGPDGNVLDYRDSDPDYDYQRTKQQQVGYQFEHEFDGGFTFRQNLRFSHLDLKARYLSTLDWVGDVAQRYATAIGDRMNVFQVDNQLESKFDTGPAAHTMLFGLDYTRMSDSFAYGMDATTSPAYDFDIDNPTYGVSGPTPAYNFSRVDGRLQQFGAYAMDQIELDKWRFTLGGRQTWVKQSTDTTIVSTDTTTNDSLNKNAFSYQLGAVYLFDNGIAPFTSYSTSFNPVTQRSASGSILDPTKGEQYELGVKYQPPGTDILLSAVAYHLVEKNKPVLVDPLTLVYESLGEVTNKGIELEARANITDGWDVIAAYSYNHSEITRGNDQGNAPAVTPKNIVSLWSNYTFQEDSAAKGLTVGAGIRYTGETYTSTANTAKNDASFYLDAALSYDFGAIDQKYKGLIASVDVRNIANRRLTVCNEGYCYLGQGRNVTASLKYRW
ncbi:iron complex outermembrane receptor protein [Rhizobium sp. ERR 922]|uniref:TonB-dependent siderophore receptor n=1 Tax=unclassified Rhizobium TaxID=2613769 RepID=UPI00119D36D4|nr:MULTISPECIES: TonB-dependent siderophore receptor [unclassified Rhizobium]TWB46758.1 iron complex outermembrane receptor protein [Rhizobium sp. ERR 922]TWB89127.1 iron complex outermembrane receptor protein [Rhizobium sp. ERR 942]